MGGVGLLHFQNLEWFVCGVKQQDTTGNYVIFSKISKAKFHLLSVNSIQEVI